MSSGRVLAVLVTLAAAATAVVSVLRGEGSAPAAAAGDAVPVPGRAPVFLPSAVTTPAGSATSRAESPPAVAPAASIRAVPAAAAQTAWGEVPIAARATALGPIGVPLRAALEAARDQMDSCFDEEAKRTAGKRGRTAGPPVRGPGVLVLLLESRQDGLDVVGTEIDSYGTSSRELVSCAGHVLQGWPIPAQGLTPGRRYRLKFPLQ